MNKKEPNELRKPRMKQKIYKLFFLFTFCASFKKFSMKERYATRKYMIFGKKKNLFRTSPQTRADSTRNENPRVVEAPNLIQYFRK